MSWRFRMGYGFMFGICRLLWGGIGIVTLHSCFNTELRVWGEGNVGSVSESLPYLKEEIVRYGYDCDLVIGSHFLLGFILFVGINIGKNICVYSKIQLWFNQLICILGYALRLKDIISLMGSMLLISIIVPTRLKPVIISPIFRIQELKQKS